MTTTPDNEGRAAPRKLISVVAGCRNEEGNLPELYSRVAAVFERMPAYDFELIIADNDSTDDSRAVVRRLCQADGRVKAIFNARNFGPERSGGHAILQATGAAVACVASDLQAPPEMIERFIAKWEEGFRVVAAVKIQSEDSLILRKARGLYYDLVTSMSYTKPLKHFTGFGLYDRVVIEEVRKVQDPEPFFRGMIAEFGFPIYVFEFEEPARKRGRSSYNIFSLIDHGLLGLFSQTRVPLRLATLSGFLCSAVSFFFGVLYLALKLFSWGSFSLGVAPIVIGLFFFASIQLTFVGILGEYIGAIYAKVSKRPLVVELERINF